MSKAQMLRFDRSGALLIAIPAENVASRRAGADGRQGLADGECAHVRAIFPVQLIGDQEEKWNKAAYKTDAYYGNPLTGFTAVP